MKKITLEQAHRILDDASAIIVDSVVTYAALDDLTGEPDNEWCCITWDTDGLEFSVKWDEKANPGISDAGELVMTDTEGDDAWITILGKHDLNNPGGSHADLVASLEECVGSLVSHHMDGHVYALDAKRIDNAHAALARAKGGAT